jgi:hypothetical protein
MGSARIRVRIEIAAAAIAAALATLTLITPDWIEIFAGVDPDRGSGALEWAIVAVLVTASVALAFIARWERRRPAAAR